MKNKDNNNNRHTYNFASLISKFKDNNPKTYSITKMFSAARAGAKNVCKTGKIELDKKNKDNTTSNRLMLNTSFLLFCAAIETVAGNSALNKKFFISQDRKIVLDEALRPRLVFGPTPAGCLNLSERTTNYKTTTINGLAVRGRIIGLELPFAYAKSLVGISMFMQATGGSSKASVKKYYMTALDKTKMLSEPRCQSVASAMADITFGYISAAIALPSLMLQNKNAEMTTDNLEQPKVTETVKKLATSKGILRSYTSSLFAKGAGYGIFYLGFNTAMKAINELENQNSTDLAP